MTKAELVTSIAEKTGLTKKDSEKALAAFVDTVTETLAKGDSIQLVGFGTFEVRERAAREGINPRHKEEDRDCCYKGSCIQGRQSSQGRCKRVIDLNRFD